MKPSVPASAKAWIASISAPFVVGLEELHPHAELPRLGADEPLEILQGGRAVDFRLALAKPVQVGAVEDRDLLHGLPANARELVPIAKAVLRDGF